MDGHDDPTDAPSEFITSEVGLAAYLSLGHPILEVRKIATNQVAFVFQDDQQLRAEVADYFAMRGAVQPLRFATSLRGLKNILHQALREPMPVGPERNDRSTRPLGRIPGATTVRRRRMDG